MIEAKSSAKEQRIVLRNDLLLYGKAMIYITPEETVRQSVILYLTDTLHVPIQEIISEQHLSHYGITSKKRADIVIHALDADQQSVPIAVIECKAPNVYLDMKAKEQMFEYCDLMGATYAMLTCILSIGNPQNCHQNSLFLEREFLVFVRTRFLHSEVLSGASMHAASDNFSRRT